MFGSKSEHFRTVTHQPKRCMHLPPQFSTISLPFHMLLPLFHLCWSWGFRSRLIMEKKPENIFQLSKPQSPQWFYGVSQAVCWKERERGRKERRNYLKRIWLSLYSRRKHENLLFHSLPCSLHLLFLSVLFPLKLNVLSLCFSISLSLCLGHSPWIFGFCGSQT